MRNLYLRGSFTFFSAELAGFKTITAGSEDQAGPHLSSHAKLGQRGRIQDKSEIKEKRYCCKLLCMKTTQFRMLSTVHETNLLATQAEAFCQCEFCGNDN